MERIEKIIKDISIDNLHSFFRDKISEFKPLREEENQITKIGECNINGDDILFFICEQEENLTERSSKKKQYDQAKEILKNNKKDVVIFIFVDKNKNFRFSFIRANYLGAKREFTSFKRYTFFVEKEKPNKTFKNQIGNCKFDSLDSIQEAFSLVPLNKEFYKKINELFTDLVDNKLKIPSTDDVEIKKKFAVKLIGRTIFCWFLKMKDNLIPEEILSSKAIKDDSKYYHEILEKLFFETLNRKTEDRKNLSEHFKNIPYLNGGLFEPLEEDFYNYKSPNSYINTLNIPNDWIKNFFETLEEYNFTIDENTLSDMQVSIDPEMLGTIFENLLAEINPETGQSSRKASGSFYTPREIVDYMVEQSLFYYLQNIFESKNIKVENLEEKLKDLFTDNDKTEFDDKEINIIIDAFDSIKILDPACGSGAFPMGILHKIVFVLKKIDPKNEKWLDKQLIRVDGVLREDMRKKYQNSDTDYIRKLGILQNAIYGVDIQTIATEISRLRCFLSLIIDEETDKEKDNMGVTSLPNLEFKFVTANTLISLNNDNTGAVFNVEDKLKEDLKKLRNEYLISNGERKNKLKREFEDKQEEIYGQLIAKGGIDDIALKIAGWMPFKNEKSDWFDSSWMFGEDGFDIVIGNPPYIQLQNNSGDLADKYKSQNYESFRRSGDIYCLFYERGINLLKENGVLSYITSNKWMRAGYGENLRNFLISKNPLLLIDLGSGVFENAIVDTNILFVRNKENKKEDANKYKRKGNEDKIEYTYQQKEFDAFDISKGKKFSSINEYLTVPKKITLSKDSWTILNPIELQIKNKIETLGIPLKDWDVNIYRGILTGYNEAFIINTETKERLCAEDPKSAEIIKPILRGRDIKRYQSNWAGLWLIFIPWHFPLHNDNSISGNSKKAEEEFKKQYLPIYNHLLKYKKELENRNKVETGIRYEWYALQRCAASYYQEFEKEKVVYGQFTNSYFYTNEHLYLSSNEYIITSKILNLKFLASYLNSSLVKYYLEMKTNSLGGNTNIFQKDIFVLLPLPNLIQKEPYIKIVDQIMKKKEQGEDTTALEREIDLMVYKLYGLSQEEIEVVEVGKGG